MALQQEALRRSAFLNASDPAAVFMDTASRYDYSAQEWTVGHDHVHLYWDDDIMTDQTAPFVTCGGTIDSCAGDIPADRLAEFWTDHTGRI